MLRRDKKEEEDGIMWFLCLYFNACAYILMPVSSYNEGVAGWCEGAVYLTSPGCPADIGLHLGKACYPCSG